MALETLGKHRVCFSQIKGSLLVLSGGRVCSGSFLLASAGNTNRITQQEQLADLLPNAFSRPVPDGQA